MPVAGTVFTVETTAAGTAELAVEIAGNIIRISAASIVSHAFRRVHPFIRSFLNISSLQKHCGLPHVAQFLFRLPDSSSPLPRSRLHEVHGRRAEGSFLPVA
jgi:hypothetical protein